MKNKTVFLYGYNLVLSFSAFLLPWYLNNFLGEGDQDAVFFYLSVLNPIILFLSQDFKKIVLLGGWEEYDRIANQRLGQVFLIAVFGVVAALFSSPGVFAVWLVLILKVSEQLSEYYYIRNQLKGRWRKQFVMRILRLLVIMVSLLIFTFVDMPLGFAVIGMVQVINLFLDYDNGQGFRSWKSIFRWRDMRYGSMALSTVLFSNLPIYLASLTDVSVSQVSIFIIITNAVYMVLSIQLNVRVEKIRSSEKNELRRIYFKELLIIIASYIALIFMFNLGVLDYFLNLNKELYYTFLWIVGVNLIMSCVNLNHNFALRLNVGAASSNYRQYKIVVATIILAIIGGIGYLDLNVLLGLMMILNLFEYMLTYNRISRFDIL